MGLIEKEKALNQMALNSILKRLQPDSSNPSWVECPKCKVEWNRLTDSGICITCLEKS